MKHLTLLARCWSKRWVFRSLFHSIYFNFHYLPFRQAARLPILLYKPQLGQCKGKIIINGKITTGMITLGVDRVLLYPNTGIRYSNDGGTLEFDGKCKIGNASAIAIGPTGYIKWGDSFSASAALKITSYYRIEFKANVHCGWDCLFTDTDFHQLTLVQSGDKPRAYDKITIGNNCWLGLRTIVMKGTHLPDYCIAGANSLLNKTYTLPPYSLIAGQPATLKKSGITRDYADDKIEYRRYEP